MPTPIKTALCSFGMSGRVFHAPFIHAHPGFELSAVWERDKSLAATIYPGIRTARSLDELFEDVELVVVNTPNYTHFDYARRALQAGKHVVVEKPFATTVYEAVTLAEQAHKHGVQLSVFQNRRYDSDYQTVKGVIASGVLGDIAEMEIHYDRYNEAISPKTHKETPGPGTGILYDLGPHLIDQALQLFGLPESIFADLRIQRPVSQVIDYMELLLYYNHFPVRLKAGYLVREPGPAYIAHGTKGSFLKRRSDVQEADLLAGRMSDGIEPESEWGLLHDAEGRRSVPSVKGNYGAYYDQLYKAIREGQPLPVTPEEGIDVMRVMQAAVLSAKEGRILPLA